VIEREPGLGSMMAQLKLMALDADDLAVISAHVQDARVKSGWWSA
jgi:hypothetical protein